MQLGTTPPVRRISAAIDGRLLTSRLAMMSEAGIETQGGYAAAVARGAAANEGWVTSGELVPSQTLADRWGVTVRALGPAVQRGEILALQHQRRRYHPSEFLVLSRSVVEGVCRALWGLSPQTQLVFWKRRHGVLGGTTVVDFLSSRGDGEEQLGRVIELARAWALEAGGR